jgi:methyl-accepting chemotaxis protein
MNQGSDASPEGLPDRGSPGAQRFDVPVSALPMRKRKLRRRVDVPAAMVPGSSGFAVATEWLGRLAAVLAVALFAMVMATIHKGLQVQDSARTTVDNFRLTNDFFAHRTDLTAPATARTQLDELAGILAQLNLTAAADVDHLAALLPDAQALVAAGQGDTQIAQQLQTVATSLQGSAASLHEVSSNADTTVTTVDSELTHAIELVNQLNDELTRTTNKLALVPETGAIIPAPTEGQR